MVPLLSLSMDKLIERKEWNLTQCHRLYLQLKASVGVIRFHVINVNESLMRLLKNLIEPFLRYLEKRQKSVDWGGSSRGYNEFHTS